MKSVHTSHPIGSRPVDGMKRCARCEQVKPVSGFVTKNRGTGIAPYCKPCKVIINREYSNRYSKVEDVTAAARFWAKVKKTETCWLWTGGTGFKGYGRFVYRGRLEQAHRVSLVLHGVDVPRRKGTDLVIDHICKVEGCVRPDHLRIVPQPDNCGKLALPTPHWKNANKTHCVRGHEFTPVNTHWRAVGPRRRLTRICVACYSLARPTGMPLDPRTKGEAAAAPKGQRRRKSKPVHSS